MLNLPKLLNIWLVLQYNHGEIIYEYDYSYGYYREKIIIRSVKLTKTHPYDVKYSLVLIDTRTGKRLVCFDNHHGKGHHFHRLEKEFSYDFIDAWQLVVDFYNEVEKVKTRFTE